MKRHDARLRISLGFGLGLCTAVVHAANPTTTGPPSSSSPPGLFAAAADGKTGQSARDIIGQKVRSADEEDLGEVEDLVIDTRTGRIAYALISSGTAAALRPVPFDAVHGTRADRGALVIDLGNANWSDAPTLRDNDIAQLTADRRGRDIHAYYGRKTVDLADSVRDVALGSLGPLMSAKKMVGLKIRREGREVGHVEDVLINPQRRTASVLLDPMDDFADPDGKFVVRFSQLSRDPVGDDVLTTTLTPENFADARPVQRGSRDGDHVYPYRWTGYAFKWNVLGDPTAHEEAARRTISTSTGPGSDAPGRPSLAVVQGALRTHADLPDDARKATIRRQGDSLVIEGTVSSAALKRRVGEIVSEFAEEWPVQNRLHVTATE